VNTHILVPEQLNGDAAGDRRQILDALRQGHPPISVMISRLQRGFQFTPRQRWAGLDG
jgi:hypothetical protein